MIAGDEQSLHTAIKKAAAIGYEANIQGAFVYDASGGNKLSAFDSGSFDPAENKYTYLDVRTESEIKKQPVFRNSIKIPLHELIDRLSEIPTGKPLLVHCASGYRSATAVSILRRDMPSVEVYDLGSKVTKYMSGGSAK